MMQLTEKNKNLPPYRKPLTLLVEYLGSDHKKGITDKEATIRIKKYGPNSLNVQRQASIFELLFSQLKSVLIWVLIIAAVLAFLFQEQFEGFAIIGVIIINSSIGVFMELQAQRSLSAISKLAAQTAVVIRAGNKIMVSSSQVTVGDLVVLEAGDVVPADCRIIESHNLSINESSLTGESHSVTKRCMDIEEDTNLMEQKNMLFKATIVVRGNATAMVCAIGTNTVIGEIASMVDTATKEITPLEKKLNQLSYKLLWITLFLATLIFLIGWIQGRGLQLMIETSIALSIAAIPEGLPIVATIALAHGMLRLVNKNVIVKKLSAVETLGETQVIFTDKTGTITENQMLVDTLCFDYGTANVKIRSEKLKFEEEQEAYLANTFGFRQLIRVAALCNNASLSKVKTDVDIGDVLEIALLKMAKSVGTDIARTRKKFNRLKEIPFDSNTKMMGTLHQNGIRPDYLVCIKGAPEIVLKECDYVITNDGKRKLEKTNRWIEKANSLAAKGLRVLAIAYSEIDHPKDSFFHHLNLIGLIGFLDPPRADVKSAIQQCKSGGIKVVMVTGDHINTAKHIAFQTGITDHEHAVAMQGTEVEQMINEPDLNDHQLLKSSIFARVSPAQKLSLVNYYQKQGYVCGMTGDGINDTPALKKADIGIAMGQRGTEAAKEVADLILQDDAFPSIVSAIKQGRSIYKNIRLFVIYLMSCNLSELLVVGIAFLANLPLPLVAMQILFINMITDVFPALALGMNPFSADVMKQTPRLKKSSIIENRHWLIIIIYAAIITATTLGMLLFAHLHLQLSAQKVNNMCFYTLILAQLWHVFNMSPSRSFFINEVTQNKFIWLALLLCLFIVGFAYYNPFLSQVLDLLPLELSEVGWVVLFSFIPLPLIQLLKLTRIFDSDKYQGHH